MTDLADRAQALEELERDAAIARHQRRPLAVVAPDDGRACADCGEPIPATRLQACPQAIRCIDDERRHEARLQHFKRV